MLVAHGRGTAGELPVDLVHDAAALAHALGVPRREREVAVAGAEHAVVGVLPRPQFEGSAERLPLALDAQPPEFGLGMDVDDGAIVAPGATATMTLHDSATTY